MFTTRRIRLASICAALVVAFSMMAVDFAEARVRGGFGSRGTRTFQTSPTTPTAPNTAAPVQRTMTPQTTPAAPTQATRSAQPSGGFFGGFGGSLFRGLMFGGLLGLLFGSGFGGFGGLLALLAQVLLIGGGIWLVMRLMRANAARPAMAGGPGSMNRNGVDPAPRPRGYGSGSGPAPNRRNADALGIGQRDLDQFETMLGQVQTAYGAENYDALRQLTTPEMMGYMAEELGKNSSRGLRNHIEEVKLLQGDVSESWREPGTEYATVAMRYSLRDWTVERSSGQITDGDANEPTQATELWTFVRQPGRNWKLSAIQEA